MITKYRICLFQISLPSGNKIWGDINGREMSFQIYSPFDNQNNLEGLCGSFDGNKYNDINVRGSGKYYPIEWSMDRHRTEWLHGELEVGYVRNWNRYQ